MKDPYASPPVAAVDNHRDCGMTGQELFDQRVAQLKRDRLTPPDPDAPERLSVGVAMSLYAPRRGDDWRSTFNEQVHDDGMAQAMMRARYDSPPVCVNRGGHRQVHRPCDEQMLVAYLLLYGAGHVITLEVGPAAPPLVDHGADPRNRPPAGHVYVPPTEQEEAEWEARHAAFQTAWVRAHPEEMDEDPDDLYEGLDLM